ncbi:hypothetical protein OSTOST_20492 [Ostertagia ostertagi]
MHQLSSEVKDNEKEIRQLSAQISALEMIASQYEVCLPKALKVPPLQILLDDCFSSFVEKVDFSSYATITRTLLTWVEQIAAHNDQFKKTAGHMVTLPFTQR